MRYTITLCIFNLLLINSTFSQNIQLKELISICTKDIGFADDLLTKKNFTFLEERKNDTRDLSEYSWRHFENFTLLISVYRSKDSKINLYGSAYFFEAVGIFNSLKSECVAMGYKKTESFTSNNTLYSIYKNDKYKIQFCSRSKPNQGAWYWVSVDIN
jgi:hypothetical protein